MPELESPQTWPLRPWLPLHAVREEADGFPLLGVLHERFGPQVFLINLCEIGRTICSPADLMATKSRVYATFAHLEEEWQID